MGSLLVEGGACDPAAGAVEEQLRHRWLTTLYIPSRGYLPRTAGRVCSVWAKRTVDTEDRSGNSETRQGRAQP